MSNPSTHLDTLITSIKKDARDVWYWSGVWTVCYHSTLIGSALASAGAGIIIETELAPESTASILAGLAAFLTTLGGIMRFQQKWIAARHTSGKLYALVVDAEAPYADEKDIRTRYNEIWAQHNHKIVGTSE